MHEHFQRYLWTNIAIILSSFVVFGLVFYFFSQSLESKVAEVLASRSAISQRSADLTSLNKLKAESAAAAEIQKDMDALLPSQDSLIGFPQFMNTSARNHSLSISFDFDGAPVAGVPPEPGHVNFSAVVEGDAANIRSFVDELENKTTKFAVNLDRLLLSPRAAGVFRADLSGQVFFKKTSNIR
jgi:hypothetical protein